HRFSSSVSRTASAFTNYVTDLIELSNVVVNGQPYDQYGNSKSPVLVVGSEYELRCEWRQGWMLSASYSLQKAQYQNDSNLREVPNSPIHLAAVKGAMPIIGRVLGAATRLSIEGARYDGQNRNVSITCDPAGATPQACPAQGATDV